MAECKTTVVSQPKKTTVITQPRDQYSVVSQPGREISVIKSNRGSRGEKGEKGDTGLTWQGEWTAPVQYYVGDAVETDGSSYYCIWGHVSSGLDKPGSGTNWENRWDLLAAQGEVGPRGEKGDQGDPGQVESAFGRIGDVVGEEADYSAFYPTMAEHDLKEDLANKAQPLGYCPLGADGKVPPEHATSEFSLQGGWDANTNDPDLIAGAPFTDGWYWIVTTAGSTNLGGITTWNEGDWAMWSDAEPLNWIRVPLGVAVNSVFGRTGEVIALVGDYAAFYAPLVHTHTESDITNLDKYTQALVDSKDAAIQADIDAHEANLLNPHQTKHADLYDLPATYPPSPHTHTESEITDLDKYTQLEVDNKDAAVQANIDAHVALQNNPHNVSYTQVGAAPAVHFHFETDIIDLDKYTKAEVDSKDQVIQQDLDAHKADYNNPHQVTRLSYTDVKTGSYQAQVGEEVLVDPTGTVAFTISIAAPINPSINDVFAVKLVGDGVIAIIADDIESRITNRFSTSVAMWNDGEVIVWKYSAAGWRIESASGQAAYVEVWQATPIAGIGTPSIIQWTFLPAFEGQVPLVFTHSGGLFTFNQPQPADVAVRLATESVFNSTTNNTEAGFTYDIEEFTGTDWTHFLRIRNSFQSSRSGLFPVSGSSQGNMDPEFGYQFRVTANEDFASGMAVDLEGALLVLEVH